MNTQNIFFTSDLHAYHKNILKFCPTTRHGEDAAEMTEHLIRAWNSRVGRGDTVYNLGDVSFGNTAQTIDFLNRLNGQHHLILGNHDRNLLQNKPALAMFQSVQTQKHLKVTLSDGRKQEIYLHHFAHRVWDKAHYGVWHFYGHSHGDLEGNPYFKSMDVGIGARPLGDMCPWSLDEVMEIMDEREALGHHSM